MSVSADQLEQAMSQAVALARNPDFVSGGNPRVGCVILSSAGAVVGTGWHRGAGTDHAEIMALRAAGSAAKGSTVVVTLEPCNHVGRTGPCAEALMEAQVAELVFGQSDPNPPAAGGAARLAAAGVKVHGPVAQPQAQALNPEWETAVARGCPYVILKLASTLDGKAAAADGSSRWITGPRSREQVHRLRARVDAVMVGTGTVLADDPLLTARTTPTPRQQPLRVVVGTREIPAAAKVIDGSAPTLRLITNDLHLVMTELFSRGVRLILVEGGPGLATALLRERLVDQIDWYIAPVLLGAEGRTAISELGISTIDAALRWKVVEHRLVGEDIYLRLGPKAVPAA